MGKVDNLQEELLKTKKSHAFAIREISILRTRIKILEKECKKKDQQIDDLLKNDQFATKSESRLQINSLKRKVVQFERALREKTEEVAKLLSDRNVAKAAETRQQLEQLNIECARLRKHLSQCIPNSEFRREKAQYMEIIGQLTDENIAMRKIIGQFKNHQQDQTTASIDQQLDTEAMMAEMRNLAMARKKDAQLYKTALDSLIHQRNSTRNSANGWDQKPPRRQNIRSRSASANHDVRSAKIPANKKFPIRSQPMLSKVAALRSKSIEVSTAAEQHSRMNRKFSDANPASVSRANSDLETMGQDILLPVERRKIRNNMYRNAIESDSSSEHVDNLNRYADEMNEDVEDVTEFPLELYDAKGNVYYVQPEEENDYEHGAELEPPPIEPDSDTVFDPNEIVEELQKQKSTDTWLENASMLSGQVNLDEESVIVRTLQSHVLRLRMLAIRQEGL